MHEVTCTITSKGQVTIPKRIRKQLGVEPSDKVAFVILESGAVEVRRVKYSMKDLFGIVPPIPGRETVDFEDYIEEALQTRATELSSGGEE